jgi:hypothetical protein
MTAAAAVVFSSALRDVGIAFLPTELPFRDGFSFFLAKY